MISYPLREENLSKSGKQMVELLLLLHLKQKRRTRKMTRKEYQLVFEALKSYKTFMTDQEKVLSEKILDSLFYQDRVDNEIKSLNFR
ncbi:hypothetical protein AVU42_gp054 [Prochlorococcus phage P-TIM68]|uniref:Uncharacterized protein n=1 Tax=Prochlorococcus phage P-TIM68 TaxID=1542477 RepID=A0A0K0KWT0_9CAUD|nr:hypothetical protein AVU42_gp054 [Prochlorococcus phage P-TIM68]AIR93599.1 hypothetical protein [Prochlorococcus phage P-TIM68]